MRLSRALKDKRPQYNERHDKVILQHDNARPHVAKVVKTYLETLKCEVLPHPLYSPDLAPSDYHLFRSMAHGLTDQHFRSYEESGCPSRSNFVLHKYCHSQEDQKQLKEQKRKAASSIMIEKIICCRPFSRHQDSNLRINYAGEELAPITNRLLRPPWDFNCVVIVGLEGKNMNSESRKYRPSQSPHHGGSRSLGGQREVRI
ncbi:mariner Mos1 transposase [Trichonephila clavipes]|nr:mariner Mos1 transposase [Trichonephila clavipes]